MAIHTALDAARYYLLHGFYPIPVPFRQKAPTVKNWPNLHLTETQLADYFNGERMNIGVLLGAPSGGTDIDLDSLEAMHAWIEFAPETGMIWGRSSKLSSHWMYRTAPPLATVKFPDPTAPKDQKGMLLELRGPGAQTIMPPSEHPSGEAIEFMRPGEPALVNGPELLRAARRTAACALLGRYLPGEGLRHDFFLAVAGGLVHARWPFEETAQIICGIYRAAWGAEADLKRAFIDADTTYKSHEQGKTITGWPTIEKLLDRRVLAKALEWLGIERPKGPPAGKVTITLPEPLSVGDLLDMDIPLPEALIEDLLPRRGLALMVGAQRSGKTIFAAQLTFALILNRPALFDYYPLKIHGSVIIMEKDDPGGDATFKKLVMRNNIPREAPFYYYGPDKIPIPLGQAFLEWLEYLITTKRAVLVVLDSYTALRPDHKAGTDIVKEERRAVAELDALGKRLNCLILLLHHESITTRANSGLDWDARGAGTYGLTMATEAQILINRYRDLSIRAPERFLRFRARHMREHQLTLRLNLETNLFEHVVDGEAAPLYHLIYEIKRHIHTVDFIAKDLEEPLGISRPTAFRYVAALVSAGALWRGDGRYRFAPDIDRLNIQE